MRRALAGWRSLTPDLRVLYWSTLLSGLAYHAYHGLLSPFLRGEGVPVEGVGLFFAGVTAVGAAATLAGGFAADRVGARPLVIAGRLSGLVGVLALLAGRSTPFLALAALAWGLERAGDPAHSSLIARHTTAGNRATALGVSQTFSSVAGTVAPVGGGALADRFGPRSALAAAVPFLAASALVLRGLRAPGRPDEELPAPLRSDASALLHLYRGGRSRGVVGVSVLWLLIGLEMGLLAPVSRLLVMDAFDATWLSVGLVGVFASLAAVAATLGGGILADRCGRFPVIVASFLLGSVAFAALPWVPRLELAYLAYFLLYLVAAGNGPALDAMTLEAVPDTCRGRFVGLTGTLVMAGMTLGSAPAGWLYAGARWLPFTLAGALELVMAGLVLLTLRRPRAGPA